ncbi:MAG: hypothetical protein WA021_02515 [Minisyncoccia bacterium]
MHHDEPQFHPERSDNGNFKAWEHPSVANLLSAQAEKIRNHGFSVEKHTEENLAKVKKVLVDYAKTIAEQLHPVMSELKPLDASNSDWKRQIGTETSKLLNQRFALFADGGFLSERLSDALGGEPVDWLDIGNWLDETKDRLLTVVSLHVFQTVSAVAYCKTFGIDPNQLGDLQSVEFDTLRSGDDGSDAWEHPSMAGLISRRAEDVRDTFLRTESQTKENTVKLEGVLRAYAQTVEEQFKTVIDTLPPLDTSAPDWADQVLLEVEKVMKDHLVYLVDPKFLAGKLSDALGGEHKDWLWIPKNPSLYPLDSLGRSKGEKRRDPIILVGAQILRATCIVAHLKKYGINPETIVPPSIAI